MFTTVPSPAPADFDLGESIARAWPAISQAYPDWSVADQAGLAAAIRQDAKAFVAANVPTDCSVEDALEIVEARMLDNFLSELSAEGSSTTPREPRVPVSAAPGMIDLVAEIGRTLPYLSGEQCGLLAGELYSQLETLVGESLAEGVPDSLLDEFGQFVDKNEEGIDAWFADNLPEYEADEQFQKLVEANPQASRVDVMSDFGAMRWLAKHRPDYRAVVARQLACLKQALAELAEQVGEDALRTWARVHGAWAGMLKQAQCGRAVIVGAALLIDLEGAEAVERWASVEKRLIDLDERAAAIGGAR